MSGDRSATVEYLRQALYADERIDALVKRSLHYRERAQQIAHHGFGVPGEKTNHHSKVEDAVVELVDISRELYEQARCLVMRIREIEDVIGRVEDDRYRDLLRWRYLNGWRWEKIAEALGCRDVRWVYELHRRALSKAEEKR